MSNQYGTLAPYKLVKLDYIISQIDVNKPLFWDMESYNDTKHYAGDFYGSIRLSQFMQEGWSHTLIADFKYLDAPNLKPLYLLIMECKVIGQNLSYDFGLLQEHLQRVYPFSKWELYKKDVTTYHDTLFYSRALYPLQKSHRFMGRYSLDDLYSNVLGYSPYDKLGIDKKKFQESNWEYELGYKQMEYASCDVYFMPELWNLMLAEEAKQLEAMTPEQQKLYHYRKKINHDAVLVGLKMQDTGLTICNDTTASYINENKVKREKAFNALVSKGMPTKLNIGSSLQVKNWLQLPSSSKEMLKRVEHLSYEDFLTRLQDENEKAVKKCKTEEALNKALLKIEKQIVPTPERFEEVQPIVGLIMDWRRANSRVTSGTKFAMLVRDNSDSRIHGHFTPTTTTGRFSSSQENMQNQPRDSKALFKAPEGSIYIGFDFAQIELRTMCALTGDSRMYEVFKSGGDIHQATQDMCGLTERVVAKNTNFGNLYGMGVMTFQDILLQNDVSVPLHQLRKIMRDFKATYPRIPEYHETGAGNSKRNIPNYSLLGHPYFSNYFNQMNNMANQASGTNEVLKVALSLYKEYGLIYSDKCNINLTVHDAVLFEYRGYKALLESYTYAIALLSQKAWFIVLTEGYKAGFSQYWDIPMPVDVSSHETWKGTDKDIGDVSLGGSHYLDNMDECEKWLKQFKGIL